MSTLYERISRDVFDSQKYLSVTDIIGVLEMIKLAVFQAAHIQASISLSESISQAKQDDVESVKK